MKDAENTLMETGEIWGHKLKSTLVIRLHSRLSRVCHRSIRDRLCYPINTRLYQRLEVRMRGHLGAVARMLRGW